MCLHCLTIHPTSPQQMLGLPVSLDDIETVDEDLHRSLKWIM